MSKKDRPAPRRPIRKSTLRLACLLVGCAAAAGVSVWAGAAQARALSEPGRQEALWPVPPLGALDWLGIGIEQAHHFKLSMGDELPLLAQFSLRTPYGRPNAAFWHGRYGASGWHLAPELSLTLPEMSAPLALPVVSAPPCPSWREPRPAMLVRHDGEARLVRLVECDGSVALDALDQVSALARPPGVPLPELPLPLEPAASAAPGEWLPGIKLLHPRLLWLLQALTDSYPGRPIVIVSGYRPDETGHHQSGRALDLHVKGITNEQLFEFCRSLADVGCGYYPNNHFVHFDVRQPGSIKVEWTDLAAPGEPSCLAQSGPSPASPVPRRRLW